MLNRFLFSVLALFASFTVAGAQALDFSTLTDNSAYKGKYAPVAAPSVIGSDGTIYQTGLYDQMIMLGDDILENIATSAYISAINPADKSFKWSVGIKGAARITALTTTADAVIVTGIFADDIVLGSKDFAEKTFTGTELSHDKVNAFVAKYSLAGNLLAANIIVPHKIAAYGEYTSDLMVNPTAIATLGGRVYISLTYNGGFAVDALSVDGTVKESFGYWDNLCAAIVSLDANLSDAKQSLDIRNSEAVNTNGLGPQSICLTAAGDELVAGIFTSGDNTLTVNGQAQQVNYTKGEDSEYGALMVKFNDAKQQAVVVHNDVSSRYYINNVITDMRVDGSRLYLSGSCSTSLPFDRSLVPDLWADQFAACLSLDDFSTVWAGITGAKRDDMPTANEKYRQTTAATLAGSEYITVGSTNILFDAEGKASPYSADYCLGVSSDKSVIALASLTDTGSKLTLSQNTSAIRGIAASAKTSSETFDLSGRKVVAPQSGIIIKDGKKLLGK